MLRKISWLFVVLVICLVPAAQSQPTPDIASFSVFATNSIWLRQNSTINSGNIGVEDAGLGPWLDSQSEVTVGYNVFVADGISVYGDSVKIKSGASISDVYYNELDGNGIVRGTEYTPLTLPLGVTLPEFPTPNPGTENHVIPIGGTLTLDSGSYGEITVKKNATLILTGDTYHFESIDLGDSGGSQVLFQVPTDVIINSRLGPGLNAYIGPETGSGITAADIRIYVNGINGSTGNLGATPKAAQIGYNNTLQANIYAPNGTLLIKQGTVAEGAFIAKDVQVGLSVQVTLNSGFGEQYEMTVEISAEPETIEIGQTATLTWTSTNADTVTIDQGIGEVDPEGSTIVSPNETTIYTITATGPGGTATDTVEVVVITPPADVDLGLNTDEQEGGGGLVGDPIRILNGNVIEAREDLRFSSPNTLGLSFQATYNSRSDILGPMGYGWSHTYHLSLDPSFQLAGETLIKIYGETGGGSYFREEAPGEYQGVFGNRTRVSAESGSYVWYRLNGTRYSFSSTGVLNWIEDEKGNRLQLDYDAQGRLETVTDTATGRTLTFYYNADGLLSHIDLVTAAGSDGTKVTYAYDANQNLTSVTYADGSGFIYTYSDPNDIHNLTEKRDKLNHLLRSWSYDDQDRAVGNFSAQGKGASSIVYVSENQVDVTDAYGTTRTYILEEISGRKRVSALQGIANAPYSDSNAVRWVYDDSLNLIEVEYAGGTINQYQSYNARGNPETVRLAVGTPEERVITYTYHPALSAILSRNEASVLQGGGNKVTIWDHDDDYNSVPNENPTGLLSRIVEQGFTRDVSVSVVPYEYVTMLTYNTKGQVVSIDGPLAGSGDSTTISYDAVKGDLLSIIRPLIGTTSFSNYDAAGRVGRVTNVNGQSESFIYDESGRLTSITHEADGSTRSIIYNDSGMPTTSTDEDGVIRSYDYDTAYGRLIHTFDHDGNYIAYSYDSKGNRIEMGKYDLSGTRTSRNRWTYQHPAYPGKLWKEIRFDESYTEYSYNASGNVSSVTDNESHTTTYGYDPLNRLKTVTQPGDATTIYTYDSQGNLASVTDALSNTTTYAYDDMGRVVSTTTPGNGTVDFVTVDFAYDAAGNLLQKTDANTITVTYDYDFLNRLTAIHFPDSAQDITYTYDAGTYGKGRRTGMTDPSGSTAFGYDSRGRLVGKTMAVSGFSYPLIRTYTPGSRLSSITYPTNRSITYSRHTNGKIQGVSTTYNSTTTILVDNLAYKPFGKPTGMTTGSGGTVNNVSEECDCLTVINPGQPMERTFSYDHSGNLTSITGTNTPWYNHNFTYDPLNRLMSATGPYGTISYTYDKVGNRLTRTADGQTDTYTYFSGTNKLQAITGPNATSFAYDFNGNVTAMGAKTFVYNQNNRLIRVEEGGNVLEEYTYNGLGQRVIKMAGGNATIFHYDFDGKIVGESALDANLTTEYLYFGSNRVAKVDVSTGAIYYYLNNYLGTPEIMTDASNTVVWESNYKPFGKAEVHPSSNVVNNFRFTGQYYDAETGLHYNYHRYYDPKTGRYLTPDPIGQAGGINLYPYVLNNPVNSVDPYGRQTGVGALPYIPKAPVLGPAIPLIPISAEVYIVYKILKGEMSLDIDTPETLTGEGCDDDGDDDDQCHKQWIFERTACDEWRNLGMRAVRACRDRANDRLRLCYRDGGNKPWHPPPWNAFTDHFR